MATKTPPGTPSDRSKDEAGQITAQRCCWAVMAVGRSQARCKRAGTHWPCKHRVGTHRPEPCRHSYSARSRTSSRPHVITSRTLTSPGWSPGNVSRCPRHTARTRSLHLRSPFYLLTRCVCPALERRLRLMRISRQVAIQRGAGSATYATAQRYVWVLVSLVSRALMDSIGSPT